LVAVHFISDSVVYKGTGRQPSGSCYSTSYMSQTCDQKHFTILEVAADWHELMIPQHAIVSMSCHIMQCLIVYYCFLADKCLECFATWLFSVLMCHSCRLTVVFIVKLAVVFATLCMCLYIVTYRTVLGHRVRVEHALRTGTKKEDYRNTVPNYYYRRYCW